MFRASIRCYTLGIAVDHSVTRNREIKFTKLAELLSTAKALGSLNSMARFIHNKRPQTATPALIKVQPTGQSQQIFLNAKNIFKLGAIFRENAQRVQKFI